MKLLNFSILLVLLSSFLVSCAGVTDAQKKEAVTMVKKIGAEIAKDAAIAAANTAVTLAEGQLDQAEARLTAAQTELDVKLLTDGLGSDLAKEQLKVTMQQAAVDQARKLLAQARAQLVKLSAVDALPPATDPAPTVPAPLP